MKSEMQTGAGLMETIARMRRDYWEKHELAQLKESGRKPNGDSWKTKYPEPTKPCLDGLPSIPNSWAWASLDQVTLRIQYGHTASAKDTATGPRFLRITDIQDGQVIWSKVPGCEISTQDAEKYKLVAGDIVFARTGATTGKSFLIRDCPNAVFASYLIRMTTVGISPQYAHWFMQSPNYWNQIEGNKRGIGQPNVNGSVLATLTIPIPPSEEQSAIVAQLEARLSRLDKAVEDLRSVEAKLVRHRASVLTAATSGTLVPTEAELARREGRDYEPASVLLDRILTERRARWEADQLATFRAKGKVPRDDAWKAKYQPPIAPDTTNLPELPEGWVWASVDQLISVLTSGSRDWSKYYGNGTGTFIMAQNVRPGRLDLTFRQPVDPPRDSPDCRRSQIEPGDLLLTIVGANTGDLCLVNKPHPEHYVCQSVALIRPVISATSKWMLTWFLSKTAGRKQFEILMYGAARPHLSFVDLLRCIVALPPEAECGRITDRINVFQSDLDHVAESARRSKAKAATLRSAILQAAFQPPEAAHAS